MTEMHLQKIIPIFNFKFGEEDIKFSHSGNFDGTKYTISLKHYGQVSLGDILNVIDNVSNFENFERKLDTEAKALFNSRQKSIYSFPYAEYFLVIDVKQQDIFKPHRLISSPQMHAISQSILRSLHLHSSSGLSYEKTYGFRILLQDLNDFYSEFNSFYIKYLLSEIRNPSILKQRKFKSCIQTFLSLLDMKRHPKASYMKILYLALRYHQTTFSLGEVPHKFLILMVVFESLFKGEKENTSRAAKRISKLISKVKIDRQRIHKAFCGNPSDTFCKIRNVIAHGDPKLNQEIVESKYPLLYKYITKAIIELILIPSGDINYNKDYYIEIDNYIENRFSQLPLT